MVGCYDKRDINAATWVWFWFFIHNEHFGELTCLSCLEHCKKSILVRHIWRNEERSDFTDINCVSLIVFKQFPKSFMWPALIIFVITCCLTTFFCVEFRRFCKFRFPHFYKYIRRMHARDKPFEMIIFHSTLAIPWCYSYMCKSNKLTKLFSCSPQKLFAKTFTSQKTEILWNFFNFVVNLMILNTNI